MTNSTTFTGHIRAYASEQNPLQTFIDLVITPFSVNKNNQAIPRSEAENIKRTALYAPVKIDLEGQILGGHKGSIPVGPIIEVAETEDSIIGRGVIWADEFPEVCDFLKRRTAENNPPGTSWEIYFRESEIIDGVEWLKGCIYAANTVVSNPSYGSETLIRAVAEDLGALMEENTNTEKTEAEGLEEERKEILDIQNQLLAMWGFLDDVYYKTFEIESAEATKTESVESFTDRFNEIISKLTERADQAGVALAEKQTTLETLQTELDALKAEVETFRAEKAEVEKNAQIAKREKELAEANITLEDTNKETILSLDDAAFALFVSALKQVSKSTAETRKIQLPDISGDREYSIEEIAAAHKEAVKSKRR